MCSSDLPLPTPGGALHEAVERTLRQGPRGEDMVDPPADVAVEGVLHPIIEEGVFPGVGTETAQYVDQPLGRPGELCADVRVKTNVNEYF